jgi:hypothetical protein
VLVEGCNSPRCKLLIDLAPSVSLVRSTQKYFRVMTRSESEEARIFVLLPDGIPGRPVLPTDLFGHWLDEYECGSQGSGPRPSCQTPPRSVCRQAGK